MERRQREREWEKEQENEVEEKNVRYGDSKGEKKGDKSMLMKGGRRNEWDQNRKGRRSGDRERKIMKNRGKIRGWCFPCYISSSGIRPSKYTGRDVKLVYKR